MKKRFLQVALLTLTLVSCGQDTTSTSLVTNSSESNNTSSYISSSSSSSIKIDTRTPREKFLDAREKTLSSAGYTYEDLFTIRTKVGAIGAYTDGPSATRVGETYYSSNEDVKCYKHETSSGALLYDGQKHEILKDNLYRLIKQNEDGEVTKFKDTKVDDTYQLNTSTFAKAIFEYTSDDIKDIKKTSTNNKYELKTTTNASSVLTIILTALNSKALSTYISALKYIDIEPSYEMFVTLTDDGYIKKYEYTYEVDLSILGQTQHLTITYSMNFTNYTSKTISLPSFDNLYINENDISTRLTKINNILNTYKQQSASSYSYKVNADIDDLAEDYSVTVKGKTVRKIENNVNYFNNYYEVDQAGYKESGTTSDVDDYDGGRGTTSDGKIYDILDPMVGFKKYEELDNTKNYDLDYFYFFPSDDAFTLSNVDYIEEINKSEKMTYNLYLKENAVAEILNMVSDSIRLYYTDDPHYNIFGTFDVSSIVIDESNADIVLASNELSQINLDFSGTYHTTVEGNEGDATFSCKIAIEINDNYLEYEIPEDKKDLISSVK